MINTRKRMAVITCIIGIVLLSSVAKSEEQKPLSVNPFNEMQDREEIFEFTQKPVVKKNENKWMITFSSKAACDATVSIVNKDGKIIRHLASGVLGKNAPFPFQQNSLSQKIEWDGLSDNYEKVDTTDCKVKVGLGLKADYDKSLMSNPYFLQSNGKSPSHVYIFPEDKSTPSFIGKGADGNIYVASFMSGIEMFGIIGRVFSKDGKYLRTFFPPPASEMTTSAKILDMDLCTTIWGDQVIETSRSVKERWMGIVGFYSHNTYSIEKGFAVLKPQKREALLATLSKLAGTELLPGPLPKEILLSVDSDMSCKYPIMAADRARDELHVQRVYHDLNSFRFSGKTGQRDLTWFSKPDLALQYEWCTVGIDGQLYVRFFDLKSRYIARFDHEGVVVPFKKEHTIHLDKEGWWNKMPSTFKNTGVDVVDCGALWPGTHAGGIYGTSSGLIVATVPLTDRSWATRNDFLKFYESGFKDLTRAGQTGIGGHRVVVINADGKILSPNAVNTMGFKAHNASMDRDGNIYAIFPGILPEGKITLEGSNIKPQISEQPAAVGVSSINPGSIIKFRGRGGEYPLNTGPALKVISGGKPVEINGALWAYGGISNGQSFGPSCSCTQPTYDLDYYARLWVPMSHLYSVMVLDSNMNRILRVGRYGNQDDMDPKYGKIHFANVNSVATSDVALYVADTGNRRIVRAVLSYAVEETVMLH